MGDFDRDWEDPDETRRIQRDSEDFPSRTRHRNTGNAVRALPMDERAVRNACRDEVRRADIISQQISWWDCFRIFWKGQLLSTALFGGTFILLVIFANLMQ